MTTYTLGAVFKVAGVPSGTGFAWVSRGRIPSVSSDEDNPGGGGKQLSYKQAFIVLAFSHLAYRVGLNLRHAADVVSDLARPELPLPRAMVVRFIPNGLDYEHFQVLPPMEALWTSATGEPVLSVYVLDCARLAGLLKEAVDV